MMNGKWREFEKEIVASNVTLLDGNSFNCRNYDTKQNKYGIYTIYTFKGLLQFKKRSFNKAHGRIEDCKLLD